MEMMDDRYQLIRQRLGPRTTFFDDIRALARYHSFKSWDDLLPFMLKKLKLEPKIVFDSDTFEDTG